MTLTQFKKTRSVFQTELGCSETEDKCHQLRYVLNKFNENIKIKTVPGYKLRFDEGEYPTRSQLWFLFVCKNASQYIVKHCVTTS